MKFSRKYSLQEIATLINAKMIGNIEVSILGINEIHVVNQGDIVFVDHPKYYDKALQSAASVILIDKEVADYPKEKALLVSEDPFRDFNKLIQYFNPPIPLTSTVSTTAQIGQNSIVQTNVVIGENVTIGKDCVIYPNVMIASDTIIGDRVVVQAGAIIGSDAFYYKNRETGYDRLRSGGNVILQDDVEIGAACTIDRGATGATTIGQGSKLDNQVHIGHDTVIGKHCLIAAQVGIAGCAILEDHVTFWGQVGMTSGATIGKGATVLAQSGISKSLEGNKVYFGYPAEESRKKLKELATIKRIIKNS